MARLSEVAALLASLVLAAVLNTACDSETSPGQPDRDAAQGQHAAADAVVTDRALRTESDSPQLGDLGAQTQQSERDQGTNDRPVPPADGAADAIAAADRPAPDAARAAGGRFRNLFGEIGKSEAEIAAKIEAAWKHFFEGGPDQRVYYPVGADSAYIWDVANDDVRSEGISYGMMIAVQTDHRPEFDRLYRWATTHMRHKTGPRAGYFAWQCGKDGQMRDQNSASDGEEYLATALLFASARWGDSGAIDYRKEAQTLLGIMLHKEDGGVIDSITNMFNTKHSMVVFTPYASAATFTDPSYHLPAFYEVWARLADRDRAFWTMAAAQSRTFLGKVAHPKTGLCPDYAEFDGTPTGAGHKEFRFDAWRVASNIGVDFAWWGNNPGAAEQSRRLLAFFRSQGIKIYGNQYELDGRVLVKEHSAGLVAMNAAAALALPIDEGRDFVDELWRLELPKGRFRYYDGMLYFLALLQVSGQYRPWGLN